MGSWVNTSARLNRIGNILSRAFMTYRGGENGGNIQRILYRNSPFKAYTGQRAGFKAISMQ